MTTQSTQAADPQTSFHFNSTKTVLQALQALTFSAKQVLRVTVTSAGVHFRCEDDGKVCQSSVRLPRAFFTAFALAGTRSTFSVQLSALADALRVFAALPNVTVSVVETPDHLVLETAEGDDDVAVCMYAHLSILGTAAHVDLMDQWHGPATELVTDTAVLREAVDDLEWPQGAVCVRVEASPFQVSLRARGSAGALVITLPNGNLRQVVTHTATVSHFYPYKFIKAALTGMSGFRGALSTQIAIDSNGLLKVVHMIATALVAKHIDEPVGSQQDPASSVVLTYAIQPMFDEDGDVLD